MILEYDCSLSEAGGIGKMSEDGDRKLFQFLKGEGEVESHSEIKKKY